MKEVIGDIWDYQADYVCITTNGYVKVNGAAVMGRGVAKQAQERFPGIEFSLGQKLRAEGNHIYLILVQNQKIIITFPVKHHWREKADLSLIKASTDQLLALATFWVEEGTSFVLPRPGCGNGGLSWEQVRPIVEVLPDNVHIIDLP